MDTTAYAMEVCEKYSNLISPKKYRDPSDGTLFKSDQGNVEQSSESDTMAIMHLTNVRSDILKECVVLAMKSHNPCGDDLATTI